MGNLSIDIQKLLLFYVLLLSVMVNNARALSPDGEVLVSFRTAILNSDGVLLQWRPEDPDPCGWKGVKCDSKTKRVISLSLPYHKLSGPISPDIGKLEQLQFLALHNNNFYGTIPQELGNCTKLRALYMQGNYLSGSIPSELGNLSMLENLDISSNSLSGSIPQSIGKLYKLLNLNVSTNFLSGPIPSEGILDKFMESSFVGNSGLCGKQVNKGCDGASNPATDSTPSISGQNQGGKKKYSGRLLISTSATVGALLLVALMCFGGCFLYKKLGKNDNRGLVMHVGGERSEQLDWDTRLNIIMGAAKGLAYLHHDCSPRIIHRDIKSSNILLDGNFEARVSDFGLAKLLEDEKSHITTIVAGTFGYLAPEYMHSGRATEKTDVYSFGVLVLEIVSGKRPTDASYIEKGLNIVGWLNFLVTENRQREIVDPYCEGFQTGSIDALLSVAIQCVSSVPDDRPTMHRVVQRLESEVMTPCPSDYYDSNSE